VAQLRSVNAKGDTFRLSKIDGRTSVHLDMMRGLAAIVVCVTHLRITFFQDAPHVAHQTALSKAFYFLTRFGPEAVIVFFVLSGLFVGSSVLKAHANNRWSWTPYLVARLTRLYLVLIPALLLGMLWDRLGVAFFGVHSIYGSATFFAQPLDDTFGRAFANVLFLQTITGPTFGTNYALWSLSNEFWYYMLFPLALLCVLRSVAPAKRLLALLASGAIVLFVGSHITAYFAVWLLGALVGLVPLSPRLVRSPRARRALLAIVLAAFALSASIARLWGTNPHVGYWTFFAVNLILGATTAAFVHLSAYDTGQIATHGWNLYRRVARLLSHSSYTLYLVHTPLLVFLSAWLLPGAQWLPDLKHLLLGCVILTVVVAYAYIISRLTEYRTDKVRAFAMRIVGRTSLAAQTTTSSAEAIRKA